MSPSITLMFLFVQCIFIPRIQLCENERIITPLDDLVLPDADTVLTGTVTMLSDKLQSLDIVSIDSGAAYRRARILLDAEISPHWGGIITARIHTLEYDVSGYMMRARLVEWSEERFDRGAVLSSAGELLRKQRRRLSRLLAELGFTEWSANGSLILEGYAPDRDLLIWSMSGKGFREGIREKYPVIVFWTASDRGIVRVFLTQRGHVYEVN